MTIHECAVVMAYTGVCTLSGDRLGAFYEYIAKLMGRPVYSHELASPELMKELQERSRPEFIAMCRAASEADA